MKKQVLLLTFLFFSCVSLDAQTDSGAAPVEPEMIFVSDTQQPMSVEKIILKSNHNIQATAAIFNSIIKQKPSSVYMLGDVVSLGYANRKWKKVDIFLDSCRKADIAVYGVLGNHDVMGRRKKGERNFQKRFPLNVRTGYVAITDSVAVVLLNSNFKTLSVSGINTQQSWYRATMASLDTTTAVKAIIVCCHHAPYTNSKIVGSSHTVQEYFVPDFIQSKKAKLFVTGHAHAFEHFKMKGKDFLVIGGGGGLHQPLDSSKKRLPDLAGSYKPPFHYLSIKRKADNLIITSYFLKKSETNEFDLGHRFDLNL